MSKKQVAAGRAFLKDTLRLKIDFRLTDQNQGVAPPPLQKPLREGQESIQLPEMTSESHFEGTDLLGAIARRRSRRRFRDTPLDLEELAMLLWATQGVREVVAAGCAFRTVPSAGCRHAFETYLAVNRVGDLARGIYRYLPLEHALVFEHDVDDLPATLAAATLNQVFIAMAPVTFLWTVIPYRMEWRYAEAAHRVIAMDVGHLCQNLYLACEAIGAGTCAVAAYHQELVDELLKVDGEEEFVLYLAPVGKV